MSQNDVVIFDSEALSWSQLLVQGSTFARPRVWAQAVMLTDRDKTQRLVVYGGHDFNFVYNDVDVLTLNNPAAVSLGISSLCKTKTKANGDNNKSECSETPNWQTLRLRSMIQ